METKYKIHFSYIISILLVVIVLLLTVKWSNNNDLIKYISFASTIASLILALLAIIYAFLSNSTLSKNVTLFNNVSRTLEDNASRLETISGEIEKNLHQLPEIVRGVDKKVEDLPNLIGLKVMEEKEATGSKKSSRTGNKIKIQSFLSRSSYNGLLVLYALNIAFKKKKPFNVYSFSEYLKKEVLLAPDYDYLLAYAVAAYAVELVDWNTGDSAWNITNFNKEMEGEIKSVLFKRAESFGVNFDEEKQDEFIENYKKEIVAVEKYFD